MRYFQLFTIAALLSLTVGCMQFDYVGQTFEPTQETGAVVFYRERGEIPPGEFRIIGRGTVTAPDGTFQHDVQEFLLEKARKYGADAVCLVRVRQRPVGLYEREDTDPAGPQKPLDPANLEFRGAPSSRKAEQEAYGESVVLQGEHSSRTEIVVQALFLKRKSEVEKRIAGQDREIGEILGEPKEPSRRRPASTLPVVPEPEIPTVEAEEEAAQE